MNIMLITPLPSLPQKFQNQQAKNHRTAKEPEEQTTPGSLKTQYIIKPDRELLYRRP